jgi:glucose-6-phosphate isomerase
VEPGVLPGDYLLGLMLGTRRALHDKDRESILIKVPRPDAYYVGVLIALFERAVGFYGTLVNINAYHQPGVEAGKKAAAAVLDLQKRVFAQLGTAQKPMTADEWAKAIGAADEAETIYHLLECLAANKRGVMRHKGKTPAETTYGKA